MIIHPIEKIIDNGTVRVTSRIECLNKDLGLPKEVWYQFPREYLDRINLKGDGLVLSLLPLAMSIGEDVEVRQGVSRRLIYHLKQYQRIFHFRTPEVFKVIQIKGERLKTDALPHRAKGVMSSFSGGVDSTYTLWAHLPQNEEDPEFQVTHAMFLHGFDIPLDEQKTYQEALGSYTELMDRLGIEMLPVRSNIKQFHRTVNWEMTHSTAVVGTAMLFDGLVSRFYYSLNDTFDNRPYFGIHYNVVPLLSTETFEAIAFDGAVDKIDKVRALAQWPETYGRLRVCWRHPDGLSNCGTCSKCTMTMNALDMVGALEKYTTFPRPLDRKALRRIRYIYEDFYYAKMWIKFALIHRRFDIAFDWAYVLLFSQLKFLSKAVGKRIAAPFKNISL